MTDTKNPMQIVACEPEESKNPVILAQMLMILADGCKGLPLDHNYTLTAATGWSDSLQREAFMLLVEGVPQ